MAEPNHARIYVCGPTTYDFAHLGHARCYVIYDVLVRHLRASGTRVTYVRNVTNVDDKIIKRAAELGEEPTALAERFYQAYLEDMTRLCNQPPDIEPKVSDHLTEIVALIERLIANDAAYVADGDVYFHVPVCQDYGKLSHRNLETMQAGASGRLAADEQQRKKHPFDFALWKASAEGEPSWPSPWGPGRPGWHIECSAMSMCYLGESFDLHGGGLDLVFPHHENEIAQSECATGKPFARMWMHNGFVQVDKEKMSKSLGNFFTAREIFQRVEPEAVRYAMLTVHYRSPLNLEWEVDSAGQVTAFPLFDEAERRLEYLYGTRQRLAQIPAKRIDEAAAAGGAAPAIADFAERLAAALDDDLNMPIALAHSAEMLSAVNELCDNALGKKGKISRAALSQATSALERLSAVLGVGGEQPQAFLTRVRDRRARALGIDGEHVQHVIEERNRARANKDYSRADALRQELQQLGVDLLDGPDGTSWQLSSGSSLS